MQWQENPLATPESLPRHAGGWIMDSLYQSNIQPIQGCDIQFIGDRGFTPTVIQIVPLRGTIYIEIKRISSNFKN